MDLIGFPKIAKDVINDARVRLIEEFNPEIIIIGGSFGKGDWVFGLDKSLLSDFELIFICKKRWSRKRAKIIAKNLTIKYGFDFSLSGYRLSRILKKQQSNLSIGNPSYTTLTYYDSINYNNIIHVKKNSTIKLPNTNLCEVPLWEAWRLFVNRLGDYLYEINRNNPIPELVEFYLFKIFQAAADTLLISLKIYSPKIDSRCKNISKVFLNKSRYGLPEVSDQYLEVLKEVLLARKEHSILMFNSYIVNVKDRNEIILFWLERLEKGISGNKTFTQFSLFSFNSILYSNIIKLLTNPKIIKSNLKFNSVFKDWRNIILKSVSSLFKDSLSKEKTYVNSYNISNKILRIKRTRKELIKGIISHWKLLR